MLLWFSKAMQLHTTKGEFDSNPDSIYIGIISNYVIDAIVLVAGSVTAAVADDCKDDDDLNGDNESS